MKLNIGIEEKKCQGCAALLNIILADEFVLQCKTRNYHWNVVGEQFLTLHKFFETQYNDLSDIIDEVAERIRSLGVNTKATLQELMELTKLTEYPDQYPDASTMIFNLLADHETILKNLRVSIEICIDKYHDVGSSDFLIGLLQKHEKMAWFLRSFVETLSL